MEGTAFNTSGERRPKSLKSSNIFYSFMAPLIECLIILASPGGFINDPTTGFSDFYSDSYFSGVCVSDTSSLAITLRSLSGWTYSYMVTWRALYLEGYIVLRKVANFCIMST